MTPIEHSLLYAMIEFPERYPEGVVKGEIEDEEFEVYLYIKDEKRKGSAKYDGGGRENEDEGNGEDGLRTFCCPVDASCRTETSSSWTV